MVWRVPKTGRSIVAIAFSIAILLSAFGLPVVANGSTVGTTFKVIANITVGQHPEGIAYDPSNGYIYVTNGGSGTVSVISTGTSTSSSSISPVTTPPTTSTSTSTKPTPSAVLAWAVVIIVAVVALIVASLMTKRRKP